MNYANYTIVFSKKKNNVEYSTFGSKFMDIKSGVDYVQGFKHKF